jgi:hypothetical protein
MPHLWAWEIPPLIFKVIALKSVSAVSDVPCTVCEGEVSMGRSVCSRWDVALVIKDVMMEEAWSRGSSHAGGAAAAAGRHRREMMKRAV